MKQLVLVAVLASVASSALTLLGTWVLRPEEGQGLRHTPAPAPNPDLQGVVQELAAHRRELAEILRSQPTQSPVARPAPRATTGAPESTVETAPSPPTEDGPPPLSVPVPTREQRLAATIDRDPASERYEVVKGDLSDRWLFRDEREILRWYGKPDMVFVREHGVEEWWYHLPEEAMTDQRRTVTVQVHAGRVISFH